MPWFLAWGARRPAAASDGQRTMAAQGTPAVAAPAIRVGSRTADCATRLPRSDRGPPDTPSVAVVAVDRGLQPTGPGERIHRLQTHRATSRRQPARSPADRGITGSRASAHRMERNSSDQPFTTMLTSLPPGGSTTFTIPCRRGGLGLDTGQGRVTTLVFAGSGRTVMRPRTLPFTCNYHQTRPLPGTGRPLGPGRLQQGQRSRADSRAAQPDAAPRPTARAPHAHPAPPMGARSRAGHAALGKAHEPRYPVL